MGFLGKLFKRIGKSAATAGLEVADEAVSDLAEKGRKKAGVVGDVGIDVAENTAHDLAQQARDKLKGGK